MGIEPTQPDKGQVADGFEDRESHQAPSTPLTSRKHETVRLAFHHGTDLDPLGNE